MSATPFDLELGEFNILEMLSEDIVSPVNEFGTESLAHLIKTNPGKNIMISPWAASECLALLRMGSRGETESVLGRFLRQELPPDEAALNLRQVRKTIAHLIAQDKFRLATGIWSREGTHIDGAFKAQAKEYFDAEVRETVFPEPGLTEINSFVSDQTRGKIRSLPYSLHAETEVVLITAVNFLDQWMFPFEERQTTLKDFFGQDGEVKEVPTMFQWNQFGYGENEAYQCLQIPYLSRLSMLFVLPKHGVTFDEILQRENVTGEARESLRYGMGSVYLPKWQSKFAWDMKKSMIEDGAGICFERMKSDFSNMTDVPLVIDQVRQETYIRVDEAGTEASAIVEAGMALGGIEPQPFEFRADRPFAYFICSPAGVNFFAGIVNDPTSGG